MSDFIDIHSHILPGLDDGPEEMADSIEMARAYVEAGFRQVFATPHWIAGTAWTPSPDRVADGVERLRNAILDGHLPLDLYTGMEIGLVDHSIRLHPLERDAAARLLPLGASGYFLIEAPLGPMPAGFKGLISNTLLSGKGVVLAHPERSPDLGRDMAAIRDMVSEGVLIQMNTGSLLGHFGAEVQDTAVSMLKAGCVHFFASDAHCARGRRGVLNALDLDHLEYVAGFEVIMQAFVANPACLLQGVSVPPLMCAFVRIFKAIGKTSRNIFWTRSFWRRS